LAKRSWIGLDGKVRAKFHSKPPEEGEEREEKSPLRGSPGGAYCRAS